MRRVMLSLLILGLYVAAVPQLHAQTAAPTPEQLKALWDAHHADFDYLLGDWEFTADSKEFGKFGGRWSAVRLDEGQILDEWRVLGDGDETVYVTTTLRAYNSFADRWELIGMDAGNGLQDVGTGRRVGDEVRIEQKFGVATGQPAIMRIRYHDIQPDRFSWAADRSTDDGKTWVQDHMVIQARRIGGARSLPPLAGSRPPAVVSALVRDLGQVEEKLIALAGAVPQASFDWRPAEGVRSFREVLMHVAADNYFLPTFAGHAPPAATGIEAGSYPSVQAYEGRSATPAEAVAAMRDSFAHLKRAFEATDDAFLTRTLDVFGTPMTGLELWVLTTTHVHEHLGQVIAYARSNGVVPPWSR